MSEDGVLGEVQQIIDGAAEAVAAERLAKAFIQLTTVAMHAACPMPHSIEFAADLVRCTVADRKFIIDDTPEELKGWPSASGMSRAVVREYVDYIGRLADILADWPDVYAERFVVWARAVQQAIEHHMADGPFRDEGGLA